MQDDVDKNVIIVVHQKLRHLLTDKLRDKSGLLINLDLENREKVNDDYLSRLYPSSADITDFLIMFYFSLSRTP